MSKWASGVGMLLCASMALGQSRSASTTDRPAQTAQTARPAPTLAQPSAGAGAGAATAAPVTAQEAMTRSKGSLLRASIEARRDPARAQIAQVSFYAVPEPEPRVLKKHDH